MSLFWAIWYWLQKIPMIAPWTIFDELPVLYPFYYMPKYCFYCNGLEPKLAKWFIYELSGSGFKSSCSHLTFKFLACFEEGVPWHSGNYRVWIHSETGTWHDKNMQLIASTGQRFCPNRLTWNVRFLQRWTSP